MPFKSEKQRRYLFANEPEIARDWTDTYGSKIQKAQGGRIGFALGSGELNRMAMEMFGKELRLLSEDEMDQLRYEWDMKKGMIEENYGDPYAKGGRIGYYTGGQSIPSEYSIEDARKTAMQDRLGGITEVMKQADLYRQGDVGQMYMANGGITRLGYAWGGPGGKSPGTSPSGGTHEGGYGRDDRSYQTHNRNIHAGMTGPSMTTAGTLSDPREKQDYFTQTYSGQPGFLGFGGGYRNLRTPGVTPERGGAYQSRLNPANILGMLGGFIKRSPPFTFAASGINTLRNKFGPAFNMFRDSDNLAEFLRRMKTGKTITNPAVRGEYGLPAINIDEEEEVEVELPNYRPIDYPFDWWNKNMQIWGDTTFPPNKNPHMLPAVDSDTEDEKKAMFQKIKDYYIV